MTKVLRILLSVGVLATLWGVSSAIVSAQSTTLDQRIAQYKKDRNTNLNQETQTIKLRCPVAQTALKTLDTKIGTIQTNRKTAYEQISVVLMNLQKSLDNQAFETTSYQTIVDGYAAKIAEYSSNITIYKQAVEDAAAVDCNKDPNGFRAALETARLYHDKMSPNITDIRSYVTNTVKPSLEQIKTQLASGRTTGGSLDNATQ